MKVIYMGTPEFAVGPLEAILKAGHEVCAVVTQPDKQKGRGKEVKCSPVKECALRHHIPVLQPTKIRAAEAAEELRGFGADIFVVAAFGQILSEEILRMPLYGCINIHASLLPRYRGAAPIQRAIMDGEKETGVTIMQMDKGIDTGDMLLKCVVPITEADTGDSLHDKLSAAGAGLVVEALEQIAADNITPEKQKEEGVCYAAMLSKEEGRIKWDMPAEQIERLVRGLNSWPSAYTSYRGKTLKIWEAAVDQEVHGEPGEVMAVTKDTILVAAGNGGLQIKSLQIEGKKRMPVKDFLLGYKMSAGEKLGE